MNRIIFNFTNKLTKSPIVADPLQIPTSCHSPSITLLAGRIPALRVTNNMYDMQKLDIILNIYLKLLYLAPLLTFKADCKSEMQMKIWVHADLSLKMSDFMEIWFQNSSSIL